MKIFGDTGRGAGSCGMRAMAGTLGFAAVALGAFGAHAFKPVLMARVTMEIWQTASFYHLTHAVLLACIALIRPSARRCFWLLVAGVLLFSGALYAFALTGIKSFAAFAPVGGVCLMAGWLCLVFHRDGEADVRT